MTKQASLLETNNTATHRPRILVVTAVDAERDAVLQGLRQAPSIDVISAGVGPAAAAASTAAALAAADYRLVISAGIGGGFFGQAPIGSIVLANNIVAADLGAETGDGFASLDELGFGSARIAADADWSRCFLGRLAAAGLSVKLAPVITVSTVTGTAATAAARAAFVPGAAAEGMEGYGVATAAMLQRIPVVEIRAISNPVGPRDRGAWRIKEALQALKAAFSELQQEFI